MAEMTAQEQLMLELINRARMDPNGEAKRFGIKLNEGVPNGDKISGDAKQVLAGSDTLGVAAAKHNQWMLRNDQFSHNETPGSQQFYGADPFVRMQNAGYANSSTAGENISFRGTSATITNAMATDLIIKQHADLFIDKGVSGRGHRTNILADDFQEIGLDQGIGDYKSGGTTFNASMVTQDFATTSGRSFITGVVYNEIVKNDDFFTVGEEDAGVSVNGGSATDTTGAGGGYELLYTATGAKTITFGGSVSVSVLLGNENIKIDFVNGNEIWTNASLTAISTNIAEVHALGIETIDFEGASSGQFMFGNKAANAIDGNGGNDTIDGGAGKDQLEGGTGTDTFVFAKGDTGKTNDKADTIEDFLQTDGDIIDLSPWDANSKKNGNQDFDFIGGQKFHKDAGELRFVTDGSDTFIQGDTNGDGKADFIIKLNGAITLTANDFDL